MGMGFLSIGFAQVGAEALTGVSEATATFAL